MSLELEGSNSHQSESFLPHHSSQSQDYHEVSFSSVLKEEVKIDKIHFIKVGNEKYRAVSTDQKNELTHDRHDIYKPDLDHKETENASNENNSPYHNIWVQLGPLNQQKVVDQLSETVQSFIQETVKVLKTIQLNGTKSFIFKFEKINLHIKLRLINNKLIIIIYTGAEKLVQKLYDSKIQQELYQQLQVSFSDLEIEMHIQKYHQDEDFDTESGSQKDNTSSDEKEEEQKEEGHHEAQ